MPAAIYQFLGYTTPKVLELWCVTADPVIELSLSDAWRIKAVGAYAKSMSLGGTATDPVEFQVYTTNPKGETMVLWQYEALVPTVAQVEFGFYKHIRHCFALEKGAKIGALVTTPGVSGATFDAFIEYEVLS